MMWFDDDMIVDRCPIPFDPGRGAVGTDLEPIGDVVVLGRLPVNDTRLRRIDEYRPVVRPVPVAAATVHAGPINPVVGVAAVGLMAATVVGLAAVAVLAVIG